ncbi:carotenoid biosynthesis protein [Labilibacter sediminis]|nr:carotenoid biosynthesis protein [Labilibacter sediminis]
MITSFSQLPLTWVIIDMVSFFLFMYCIVHVIKTEKTPIPKVFTLFAFLIYSGIFENIGHAMGWHPYSPYRILRVGNIGLGTSMMEAVLFYSAYVLVRNLKMPGFLKPFAIAFLASVADFVVDPVMHWDAYMYEDVRHTQWMWTPDYSDNFFGVPFYNFSGWIFLMLWFALSVNIGEWVHKKFNYSKKIGYIYPWLLPVTSMLFMVMPTSTILLYGSFNGQVISERIPELIMLCIHCTVALFILIRYRKISESFNAKKDAVGFIVPMAFNMVYVLVGFARGLSEAYVPMIVVTVLHAFYLFYIYKQGKLNKTQKNIRTS